MPESTIIQSLLAQGIRRYRKGNGGFVYRSSGSGTVDQSTIQRIRRLRIPPGWTKVAVNPAATGRVQAIGRDKAGRWQYRYHAAHSARQSRRKFERLIAFIAALPALRRHVRSALATDDLSRDRVFSGILKILLTCFLRPGSLTYAEENGSFGIVTLLRRHAAVHGSEVHFDFPGKSGKRQIRAIKDRAIARLVAALLRLPGRQLFRYRAPNGDLVRVRRRALNAYVKELMGHSFSAKDFRTWAGTLICACALARSESSSIEKGIRAAIRETANSLGNTPAVCRASYIAPAVLESFRCGNCVWPLSEGFATPGRVPQRKVERCERSLVRILRGVHGSRATPRASREVAASSRSRG